LSLKAITLLVKKNKYMTEILKASVAYALTKKVFEDENIEKEIGDIAVRITNAISLGYLMTHSEPISGILKANKLVHHLDELGYHCGMQQGPTMMSWYVHANWEMMPLNRRESIE